MLFDYDLFPRIERGEITLTFRNWSRPQARPGARHRLNPSGVLAIESVERVRVSAITADDARRAGFADREALVSTLRRGHAAPPAEAYRVQFRFVSEADPRSTLANTAMLSDADLAAIAAKLDRMDARSEHGAWTRETLRLIADNPHVISTTLAARLGRERMPFKLDIRKLKALGLTISHEVGYEISPRGRAFLERERGRQASRR